MTHEEHTPSCCAPGRTQFTTIGVGPQPAAATDTPDAAAHSVPQVSIPAGTFRMGDSQGIGYASDGETPVHEVELEAFSMDATTVTNADFARFVNATDYVTEAERFGVSAVFDLALSAVGADIVGSAPATPWWLGVAGADWRHPQGRLSTIDAIAEHPVVHISWNDAQAYCDWAGRRMPTEAEWEYACRGGIEGTRWPWGDDLLVDDGSWQCNIWQGTFPTHNTLDDGFLTTAPARSFAPNGYGLYSMVGNVWEWCVDYFDHRYYAKSPRSNPRGPDSGDTRVLRGGSFLCHDSYCNRYRTAARSSNTPDSSMANAGFRTVGPAGP